ncbi:MFS transporter [Sandaracinus amylolyticus]|uniref:1-acyl-sn-glycerol-3-phosphate acyltransferase n=1 Tax=Sandaracinus amylolyticus TaxID=927083 RepID=A0A0F6YKX9_9BACT|nr:MFS transporter [Sandaracinus amylolyticus]AKF07753.1 1-acyl-sn-glycerol-3-phosphate acyltransferase [Sandaracinus amylolyticus]
MSQSRLLAEKRFAPFFWTQFLGAFNDNVFKNALVILFTLTPPSDVSLSRDALVNLASGLLILPFFIFSATAGQLAEKMEKSRLVRWTKLMEIAVMIVAAFALFSGSAILLLALLFMLGLQSAIFGPVKFAILPSVLREDELVGGNGLVEMGTYVAILGGTMLGGVLVAQAGWGVHAVAITIVVVAVAGYVASRGVPQVPSAMPGLRIDPNVLVQTWRVIGYARENRAVWLSVLGNSWFWFVGALFLAQLPGFVEDVLHGSPEVVTLLLIVFSLGVGIGSLLCERLSGRVIELGLVPFGSIGITFFAIDLFLASEWHVAPAVVEGPFAVLADSSNWRILMDLALLGVFGGFYSVPLNAMIQHRSDPTKRSRIIAANNIVNAIFIVGAAGVAIVLLGLGLTIPQLFLAAGVMNALVALYIYTLLPEFLFRFLVWLLMHTMYRLRVKGVEKLPSEGPALLVCNHVAYVDALILAAASSRPIRFVMWWKIFEIPLLKWMFGIARAIPIAGRKEKPELVEKAFAEIDRALAEGELVCIFPEGALTYTGELSPFRPGVERIVASTPVPVFPMALKGLWGSWFSRRGGPAMAKRPRRFRSQIELEVGDAIAPADATAERLQHAVQTLRGDAR